MISSVLLAAAIGAIGTLVLIKSGEALFRAFDWLSRQPDWVIILLAFATPVAIFGPLILSFHH